MATLIGDVFTDSSRFHPMIGGAGIQHAHPHESPFQQRSLSRSRDREAQPQQTRPDSSPRAQGPAGPAGARYPSYTFHDRQETAPEAASREALPAHAVANSGVARLPSPPSSSSPSQDPSNAVRPKHATPAYTVSAANQPSIGSSASSASTDATVVATPTRAMPLPGSDNASRWDPGTSSSPLPTAGSLERSGSPIETQTTIRVRDLAHIQTLAKADLLSASGPGILNDPPLQQMKYDISAMPIGDIIEMVAALLTKITTTNDLQHDAPNRNANHIKLVQAHAVSEEGGNSGMSPLSSSVLAFHGKNVPAITILSYLSRIHKYCPTTFEVFLSLLVYFDRMTERVNDMVMKSEETRRLHESAAPSQRAQRAGASAQEAGAVDTVMTDDAREPSDEVDSDLADDDDDDDHDSGPAQGSNGASAGAPLDDALPSQATYFVVDSFNIHRLIIAGVTCASKFFSDVFYTNSRYAKVGGLPLAELNHLELQFLLLNDFRLAVPVEDLEAYATMLVEFYAREVVAQRSRPVVTKD